MSRTEIKIAIAIVIVGFTLAKVGLDLILNARENLVEEKSTPTFWSKMIFSFPDKLHIPILMLLGSVFLCCGVGILYVPLSFTGFVPDLPSFKSVPYDEMAENLEKYEGKADAIGFKMQEELTAKFPNYHQEYDDFDGVYYVLNRESLQFGTYLLYYEVTEDKTESQIRKELDGNFELIIKNTIQQYSNPREYNEARDELIDYYGTAFVPIKPNAPSPPQVAQPPQVQEQPQPQQPAQPQQQQQRIPTLQEADQHLAEANNLWKNGDRETALKHANRAYLIRKHHLGEQHQKTKEVRKMLEAATRK